MEKKLLYRVVEHNGGLVFAWPERARYVARIHEAINTATTWEQFRRLMPRQEYSKILRIAFEDNGESRPRGQDPFSEDMLPGWSDGDYPPWLQQEMENVVPREVLERYGKLETTPLNGSYWMLPPEHLESICASLESMGWKLEAANDLPFH